MLENLRQLDAVGSHEAVARPIRDIASERFRDGLSSAGRRRSGHGCPGSPRIPTAGFCEARQASENESAYDHS